jgi:hypothetical protein
MELTVRVQTFGHCCSDCGRPAEERGVLQRQLAGCVRTTQRVKPSRNSKSRTNHGNSLLAVPGRHMRLKADRIHANALKRRTSCRSLRMTWHCAVASCTEKRV